MAIWPQKLSNKRSEKCCNSYSPIFFYPSQWLLFILVWCKALCWKPVVASLTLYPFITTYSTIIKLHLYNYAIISLRHYVCECFLSCFVRLQVRKSSWKKSHGVQVHTSQLYLDCEHRISQLWVSQRLLLKKKKENADRRGKVNEVHKWISLFKLIM